jgi:glycosyltransferase involved in cell wall biosynthesis
MNAQTPPAEAVAADVRIVKSFCQEVLLGQIGEHTENSAQESWTALAVQPSHGAAASTIASPILGVIFSKDRPLQLDGTLRSFFARCQDAHRCQMKVLYRASVEFQPLYDALIREYPMVGFVAEQDFRSDLIKLLGASESILFVVDDNLFIRNFTATEMVEALREHPQAIGFSMRLGRNTTFCYPLNKTQSLPSFETVSPQILRYDWTKADCDFNYPLEVSSSVYRAADLLPLLHEMPFKNPNTLEGEFAARAQRFHTSHPQLLCFGQSRAFCNPINLVQKVCQNRTGGRSDHSPERLAERFRAGARLDVEAYINVTPTGCHQEMPLHFVKGSPSPSGPAVSVVIPCYKQAHYLPEAVQSVLAQTFTDWELIIVNDGSPDNTSIVAGQFIKKHPGKIRLIEKANGGLSSARNAGIRAARGEYIFLLDADDRIQPTMLEKTKTVLDTRPSVGFAYTHIQHFGDLTNMYPLPDFDRGTLITKDNIVCAMSLVRKAAWQQAGGYNELMREGYEDWDFWISCVEHGWEGFRIPEPLACYRKSATSMLSGANQKRERLIATIVCNHPRLYDAKTRAWADKVMLKSNTNSQPSVQDSQSVNSFRVTYLISSILGVTGGNQTLLRQADELQRRGHDVTIVTYTPKPDWFTFKMRVVQVPAGQAMAPHVPPSDVVISTYFMNTHELLAVKAAVKVYYAQGDQYVFADTTLPDSEENRRWRELSRASYLLPNVRFVPNSHNLARAVEKMTGRKPDGLLPVCTDQTIFRPLQRSLSGSRARILIVGPDVRGSSAEPLLFKGIQDIHDALLLLAKRHLNFTAVRMSGTPPEIFQRYPCEFYVAPSDEMKTVLFGTADILIYASHYDSCPRPPQEAMASGCAVVCTATEGAMEYCRDDENCLLVPIQSPQAIADATLRLIRDRALRERLVQGGLATARKYPREREWNELETMLRYFVEEASDAFIPATASLPPYSAQPAVGAPAMPLF